MLRDLAFFFCTKLLLRNHIPAYYFAQLACGVRFCGMTALRFQRGSLHTTTKKMHATVQYQAFT